MALEADFDPDAVAMLLVLIERGAVVVPLTSTVEAAKPRFREIAEVEWRVEVGPGTASPPPRRALEATHPLLVKLREEEHPGLVLFSSGSTGEPKAALHDFVPLLDKFRTRRRAWRTMAFLLFDHIGGINTLFHTLSNGGTVVVTTDRSPEAVSRLIAEYQVELLPTSPTFLNLLLVSEAYRKYDLSSLQLVTYGTEVMPEATLRRIHEALPQAQLQQTYGLSELGILRSKSRSSESLWVKLGGEGYETRVVDGLLEIKARSAMLGYLNAPSPFTEDGWFRTGDRVEVDGEELRILGRVSEVINVGGQKVDPVEVEDSILRSRGRGRRRGVPGGQQPARQHRRRPHPHRRRRGRGRVPPAPAGRAGRFPADLQDPPEALRHHRAAAQRPVQAPPPLTAPRSHQSWPLAQACAAAQQQPAADPGDHDGRAGRRPTPAPDDGVPEPPA